MTPEGLVMLLGSVLSLVFAYFPWVKDWFEGLGSVYKPLVNVGFLLALAFALVGFSCLNIVNYFECSGAGVLEAIRLWILAVVANIVTYTTVVRQVKQK